MLHKHCSWSSIYVHTHNTQIDLIFHDINSLSSTEFDALSCVDCVDDHHYVWQRDLSSKCPVVVSPQCKHGAELDKVKSLGHVHIIKVSTAQGCLQNGTLCSYMTLCSRFGYYVYYSVSAILLNQSMHACSCVADVCSLYVHVDMANSARSYRLQPTNATLLPEMRLILNKDRYTCT